MIILMELSFYDLFSKTAKINRKKEITSRLSFAQKLSNSTFLNVYSKTGQTTAKKDFSPKLARTTRSGLKHSNHEANAPPKSFPLMGS